jgi:putative Holliday junction resolvase
MRVALHPTVNMRFWQAGRIIQAVSKGCNPTLFGICSSFSPYFLMEKVNSNTVIRAPIIAIDLGAKRVGIAVSDSLSISITRLEALPRTNWKQLLRDVGNLIQRLDAQTVVIGLPLRLNGSYGDSALEVQRVAQKFAQSLNVPVYLQDERLSSVEAEQNLRVEGKKRNEVSALVDSEAAALILRDFMVSDQERIVVPGSEQT